MKKLFLLLAIIATVGFVHAQDGEKLIKKASRQLGNYKLDPANNADKLMEARDMVLEAYQEDAIKNDQKSNQIYADVLSAVAQKQLNAAILDETKISELDFSNASLALDGYINAYNLAEKKFQLKDAAKGLATLEGYIENTGIVALQSGKYKESFMAFSDLLKAGAFLKEKGEETSLDIVTENEQGEAKSKRKDIISYALNAGVQEDVDVDISNILQMAIAENIEDPAIYQIAYLHYNKTDKDKARDYLNQGREMFPTDSGLLFAEINAYIEDENLEGLIDKLKLAIEQEPENASVYSTLGNVYDQLFTQAIEQGNEEKAEEYFQGALEYYKKSTEFDDQNYSAYYGVGALYFNKAAGVAKEMNELSNDFSAAGIKKYQAKEQEMKDLYAESFPYLEKAEEIDGDDPLVLTALREYYARMGDLEKSNEYKLKLEAIE